MASAGPLVPTDARPPARPKGRSPSRIPQQVVQQARQPRSIAELDARIGVKGDDDRGEVGMIRPDNNRLAQDHGLDWV